MTWSGNGSQQTITFAAYNDSAQFQPDFTWIKKRNGATNQMWTDSVRGATKTIHCQNTDAESTVAQALKSFNSDGFVLGTDGDVNASGGTYVGWNWKAGTSFTNDASSTGIGTLDSAGSFNNDTGFSVVTYTGNRSNASLKHGLNIAPKVIFIKGRNATYEWRSYFAAVGAGKYMVLNEPYAEATGSNFMNNTSPTSSVFSLGDGETPNNNGTNYVAYCFAPIPGFSKMQQFLGNGSESGPFVYTSFKPSIVIIKKSSGTGNWQMFDNNRSPVNVALKTLSPDVSDAEYTTEGDIDMLSNGFKIRSTGNINANGETYIYMAFAENPFVTSTDSGSLPVPAR